MKIAVLCSDTGVRLPDSKGASIHLAAITEALAGTGHEVMVVGVAGREPWTGRARPMLFPHPGRSIGLAREVQKIDFAARLEVGAHPAIADFAPDVIYERLSLFGTAGAGLAARTGACHVLEVNALLAEEEERWRGMSLAALARLRELSVLAAADLRVAVSEELAQALNGVAAGRPTVVLPNGVDAAAFASLPGRLEARERFGLPADRPVVGFAGTLRPWHGLDNAVRALPKLRSAILTVAGGGAPQVELARLAAHLGVTDRIVWLGQLSHRLVPAFLSSLDVALLPYPELPDFAFSPLKLYEYLAAGVPVVASDLGQIRKVLRGGAWGRLVQPGSPSALADAIAAVLAEPTSSRAAAAEAREHTLRCDSWDQRARRLVQLFTELGGPHRMAS